MSNLSPDQIAEEVRNALEATLRMEEFPERLWPYTAAELNFLREFVTRVIVGIAQREAGDAQRPA